VIVGQGFIAMDVALFMMVQAAALVQIYLLPSRFGRGGVFAVGGVLRLIGWVLIASRFGQVLFTTGDIYISIPSAIAVMFLACAEIAMLFNRGKKVTL